VKLAEMLKNVGAVKFGEFILSSGQKSNVYVDIKLACTYPEILDKIVEEMEKKVKVLEFDRIACIELGGVPLAVALSLRLRKPYVIFRKRRKEYGTKDELVGNIVAGEKVLVVEDVTTTGSSAMSVVERVEKRGGKVVAILTVVNRGAKLPNLISILTLEDLIS